MSDAVYYLTNSEEKAKTSVRISISHLTTKEEIDIFLNSFDIIYNKNILA